MAECGCDQTIRDFFDADGIEVIVRPWRPGMTAAPYAELGMRCPHGVSWHAEPSLDQRLRWIEQEVR